jgi:hypothetical protein
VLGQCLLSHDNTDSVHEAGVESGAERHRTREYRGASSPGYPVKSLVEPVRDDV